MAIISITEILGTDNVASSRPVINRNFQTVTNAINVLETFLNTTPPGASLQVGSATLTLGINPIGTVLLNNQGSALIAGNLSVNTNFVVGGTSSFNSDVSVVNKLLVTGTGPSPSIVIGDVSNVPLNLRNITLIDESLSTSIPYIATTETIVGTGINNLTTAGRRSVILDYTGLTGPAPGIANIIQLDAGIPGQRIHFVVSNHGDPGNPNATIWFANTNFNSKYDQLPAVTPYDGVSPAVNVALGIDGSGVVGDTSNDFERKYVELVYKITGWEVYNSHPDILGL